MMKLLVKSGIYKYIMELNNLNFNRGYYCAIINYNYLLFTYIIIVIL